MDEQKDNSPESLLARLREGYKQKLEIKVGGLSVPCRILPADESVKAISNAKFKLKIPEGHEPELLESIAIQKSILKAGCTVDEIPYLHDRLLDKLSSDELAQLYDAYMLEVKFVNPEFETLNAEQVAGMIDDVKKKKTTAKDYYSWQLAEIGRYCLNHLFHQVKERGL